MYNSPGLLHVCYIFDRVQVCFYFVKTWSFIFKYFQKHLLKISYISIKLNLHFWWKWYGVWCMYFLYWWDSVSTFRYPQRKFDCLVVIEMRLHIWPPFHKRLYSYSFLCCITLLTLLENRWKHVRRWACSIYLCR